MHLGSRMDPPAKHSELLTNWVLKAMDADQGTSQSDEGFVDVVAPLVVQLEAAELVQPTLGPFDHPAVHPQAAAMVGVSAGDPRPDAPPPQLLAVPVRVVPAIGIERIGPLARRSWAIRRTCGPTRRRIASAMRHPKPARCGVATSADHVGSGAAVGVLSTGTSWLASGPRLLWASVREYTGYVGEGPVQKTRDEARASIESFGGCAKLRLPDSPIQLEPRSGTFTVGGLFADRKRATARRWSGSVNRLHVAAIRHLPSPTRPSPGIMSPLEV
jgi:hypothetical protein